MAIKLDCPRCNKPLSVPSKKAGSYVNCPQCMGRFWVPKDAPADDTPAPPLPTPPLSTPPLPTPPPSGNSSSINPVAAGPLPAAAEETTRSAPASQGGPPPPPLPPPLPKTSPPTAVAERKTARFISAEVARSTLEIAEDGQLPELQLQEREQKKKTEERSDTTINPLVLFGVVSLGVVASVLLVLYEGPERPESQGVRNARAAIERCWSNVDSNDPLKPYQLYLRQAHLAHTHGDFKAERQLYRKVYQLLQVEGRTAVPPDHARVLEEEIPVLLNAP